MMDRYCEIEELAELVAEEHWVSGRVNPATIAATSGITFNFGHYASYFDGYLECKSRRFHIYLNLDTNRYADAPRARFSFAHELGHYFLDWHRHALEHDVPPHGSKADFTSGQVVEREADMFAAGLLLPKSRLTAEAKRRISASEIQRLSVGFGTSLSATAIRCARLDLAPLVVMRWTTTGRAWCWSSPHFERKTRNWAYRQLNRIPDGTLTRLILADPYSRTSAMEGKGTTLSSWFPSIYAGGPDDDILLEECLGLGPHGALTLLRPPD